MDGATNYALVIGIDDYGNGVPKLHNACADARAVADQLRQRPHCYEVTLLCDAAATVGAVERFFHEQVPEDVSPDSSVVVYFAGHGVAEDAQEGQGPEGYLLLHDAELADRGTWMRMDRLRAGMHGRVATCRHVLVVLDCCHAGAFRWTTATRDVAPVPRPLYKSQYDRYRMTPAWQALTSAAAGERAADGGGGFADRRGTDQHGHSPFAAAFIGALQGGADLKVGNFEPDGVITATELYMYIDEYLKETSTGVTQTPNVWALEPDKTGQFVFHNPKIEVKPVEDPPLDDANNPWRGLDPYDVADADVFLGRSGAVQQLLDRVTATNEATSLVGVSGPSGAGKTSLVLAGLLPKLLAPSDPPPWNVVMCERLLDGPLAALERAQARLADPAPGQRRLLVIDQMDEVFAPVVSDAVRAQFFVQLNALIEADDGPKVLLIIRSDFEARLSAELPKGRWSAARWSVPPLDSTELREVIEGPANARAIYFEPPELVDQIRDEVTGMPGALPVLSFAMSRLYAQSQLRRRTNGDLDRGILQADFDAIGGVTGLLNKTATDLYEEASSDERRMIERIFLRLVSQQGSSLTRRRVENDELDFGLTDEEREAVKRAKARYVEKGLLVDDGMYVEPAHSALVREWEKLHLWLDRTDTQELFRSAWYAAKAWQAEGADKSSHLLWDDNPRLPQLTASAAELNTIERRFQVASRKRRRARRQRFMAIWITVIVALLAATAVANVQRVAADRAARRSEARALAAASEAQGSLDPELALLLAAEAHATDASPVTEAALLGALTRRSRVIDRFDPATVPNGGEGIEYVVSPDGTLVAALGLPQGESTPVTFIDVTLGLSVIGAVDIPGLQSVTFARGSRRAFITAGFDCCDVIRVDVPEQPSSELRQRVEQFGAEGVLDVTADGRVAIRTHGGGGATIVDFDSGERQELDVGEAEITAISTSADGGRLAVASDEAVHVFTLPELEPVTELSVAGGPVSLAVSPDGLTLAVVTPDQTDGGVRTLSVSSLASDQPTAVVDPGWLLTFPAAVSTEELEVTDRPAGPDAVEFSADGSVVAASGSSTLIVPVGGRRPPALVPGRLGGLSPDGTKAVVIGPSGSATVVSTEPYAPGAEFFDVTGDDVDGFAVGAVAGARFNVVRDGTPVVTVGERLFVWASSPAPSLLRNTIAESGLRIAGVVRRGAALVGTQGPQAVVLALDDRAAVSTPLADAVREIERAPARTDVVIVEASVEGDPAVWRIDPDDPTLAARTELPIDGPQAEVSLLATSPDRRMVAVAATPQGLAGFRLAPILIVYDIAGSTAVELYRSTSTSLDAPTAAFVGDRTVVVSDAGRMTAVDLAAVPPAATPLARVGMLVTALAGGPDGSLALGGSDGRLIVLDAADVGRLLSASGTAVVDAVSDLGGRPQPGHALPVVALGYSPAGDRIVSQDAGGRLHVVDPGSRTLMLELELRRASGTLRSEPVLTDGSLLVPQIGGVRYYDLATETLVERACIAAGRGFREVERQQYLDGEAPRSPCGQ